MKLKKNLVQSVLGCVVLTFCALPNANAIFPTFDIAEVAQTISSANSQVQSVLNSAQSTVAQVNIQQSIGDALGGLSKFKDLEKQKKKIEKAAKKAQAAKERYEKAKKRYEEAQKTYNKAKEKYDTIKKEVSETVNDAKQKIEGVKEQVNNVQEQVNNFKEQANNIKAQAENTVNQVKNGYNQAVSTYEQTKNAVETKVNGVKNTVEGYKTQAEGVVNKINGQSGENVSVSGVQTQTFDIDESSLDAVSVDDLWNSPETLNPSPVAVKASPKTSVLPKKTIEPVPADEKNLNFERTSFKKVSYLQNLPIAFAAESSGFAYGVNTDTGRFVISNTMAEWCNINFDEEDENTIAECIKTMVTDMHNPDSAVAAEYRKKFEQVKKETLEAMIVIAAVNSSYSGGFEESVSKDLESKSDATDTVRDNIAYLSEVERANQEIQRRMLDVQPIALMYQTLEAIETLDKDVYDEE